MTDREKPEEEEEEKVQTAAGDFNILPEGCISNILSLTSPRDACRSSLVSSFFKSVAETDAVWERFLPSDYAEIISRSSSDVDFSCSKKQLFFRLCHTPILIDGGSKSFALEKRSGKKCFMLGANELKIMWEDTFFWRCTWRSPPDPESRFAEVTHLDSFYWLGVHGKLETQLLSPKTLYTAYFVFKFIENYELDELPVDTFVTVVGGGGSSSSEENRYLYLDPDDNERNQLLEGHFPLYRGDGWMEIEMGHFFNDGECGRELQMTLKEIEGLHSDWKRCVVVEGIELRPAQCSKDSLSTWKSFLNGIRNWETLRMIMTDLERAEEEQEEMVKEVEASVDFNILPERCISNILSLTSPRDVCRSSLVSPLFKSAAESDAVWERFLPPDYAEIISRSFIPSLP